MSDDDVEDGGFVRRWSRLKRTARQNQKATAAEDDSAQEMESEATAAGGDVALSDAAGEAGETASGDEEVKEIAVEDLPDIDSLQADSDFTPFMQTGVPEQIKNLALRKLWKSDPILANIDGLNDYDEDFKAAMEIGAAFIDRARAAGAKFIGEPPDEPEETETPEDQGEVQEIAAVEPEEAAPSDQQTDDDGTVDEADESDEAVDEADVEIED